jgi:dolichyl-phosphate beta-glucosyltransferase
MIQVSLIFPAYNESKIIANTIQEAVAYFEKRNLTFEIIVAADGTDGTREIVRGMNDPRIKAIGEEKRSGKGLGIKRAVEIAQGKFIGYSDADNKTPISEFDHVLPFLEKGNPMVIGSRSMQGAQIEAKPLVRKIGSFGFRYVMQAVTGLYGVPDTQCGFKFFRNDIAKRLFSLQTTNGYMFDVEILLLARKLGISFEQVPIRWKDDGDTRLNMISGNIRNLLDLAKMRHRVRRSI